MSSLAAVGADPDFDPRSRQSGYSTIPRGLFDQAGAAVGDTLTHNPLGALYRTSELFWANVGENTPISKELFNQAYGDLGLQWHRGMSAQTAAIISERKKRENERNIIMGSGPEGALSTAVVLGSSLAASFLDPVNISMSFIPVLGQAKWGQLATQLSRVGKATTISQRIFKTRLALALVNRIKPGFIQAPALFAKAAGGSTLARGTIGFIEGSVGTALTEPLILAAAHFDQSDYDSADSVYSILLGGVLGGTLHAGIGKLGDFFTARGKKITQAELQQAHTAAKQMADGKSVDVSGLKEAFDAEITIATKDGSDFVAKNTSLDLDVDFGLLPNIEIKKVNGGFEARFEGDTGSHFTSFSKSQKQARISLMTSYESARMQRQAERLDQKTVENKSSIEAQHSKIESLVEKRNQLESALRGKAIGEKDLAKLKKQLKELNSPEAFELKLQKLGFPMDVINLKRQNIDLINKEISDLGPRKSQKAAKKKIKQLREELDAARQELTDRINNSEERDVFASAKEQLKIARQNLRTKIKGLTDMPRSQIKSDLGKVNKEIALTKSELDKMALESARDNIIDQETNWKRDAFPLEPKQDISPDEVRMTKEKEVEALDREITELQEEFSKVTDETLENSKNPDIVAEREAIKIDELRADAIKAGVDCLAQIGVQ